MLSDLCPPREITFSDCSLLNTSEATWRVHFNFLVNALKLILSISNNISRVFFHKDCFSSNFLFLPSFFVQLFLDSGISSFGDTLGTELSVFVSDASMYCSLDVL